jgi:hypothetical protein
VRPVRIDPTGRTGPTPGQAYGPKWRRSTHGLYVPTWVDATVPEQRILEQSMRLPEGGAVTGWAALRKARAGFFDGLARDGRTELDVPLCVGPLGRIRDAPGSTVHRDRLLPDEVVVIDGVRCARTLRGLFDAMRLALDEREAVVAMDMAAAASLASISQMLTYTESHPGWEGVQQVRDALPLADERSRSPSETRTRLVWQLDAGLPKPLVNQPVWDLTGRLLGYADLFDPVAGVVGEYDGADHRAAKRHSKDVAREERFRRRGLEYFKVTGPDTPAVVVDRMLSTRSRARWLAPGDRAWTIEPPPGWEPELSLDGWFAYREMIHRPADDEGPFPAAS